VRMHQQMQERCAAIIQSTLRCYFERLDFLALTKAAKQLSSYFRVRHIRYGFLLVRQLAASIQAQVRGFLKRKQISSLRKKRLLSYRVQLFELWRRSATPLSYRAKFWKLFKQNTFLNLALHEEELARVWEVLDIKVSVTTTVYDKCKQIQHVLDAKKQKATNELVPIFPAEMRPKRGDKSDKKNDFLRLSKIRLAAERQKLYSILKHMDINTKNRVFNLFKLDDGEEKKKERIVKCLWEYRALIKPSITFILNIYDEFGNLQNVHSSRSFMDILIGKQETNVPPSSILRRFDLDVNSRKTYDIVKNTSKNMSIWVQLKYDERIQNDVVASAHACFDALYTIDKEHTQQKKSAFGALMNPVSVMSHTRTNHIRSSTLYLKNADLNTKQKRLELAQAYFNKTPTWSS